MKITNEFTVNTPIDRAWALLTDLEGIAPCMPGAQLTGVDGDVYQGKVKVKVGPVISEFAGTAQFTEKDDDAFRAVIDAKGRDARSAGNAAALVTAQLQPDGEKTLVSVDTDLKISGKLAQFGAGMIKEVSGKLLAQFVANLETKLAVDQQAPAAEPSPVTAGSATAAAQSGDAVRGPGVGTASATADDTAPGSAAVEPAPVEPATVLSPAGSTAGTPATATPAAAAPAASELANPPSGSSVADFAPGGAAAAGQSSAGATAAGLSPGGPGSGGLAATESVVNGLASGASGRAEFVPSEEPEALDLMSLAGGSIYKRLVPVAVGVVAVGAVITWLIVRRR